MDSEELASMTVAEIEKYKLGLRLEIDALRAKMDEAEVVRGRKINAENLARQLGQDVSHLTEQEIDDLLRIALKPKPGDVVAEIGTAVLVARGQGGEEDDDA